MANPSEEAVAIGRSQMRRYLDAIGNLKPKDENDLCDIAVYITVACKKSTYTDRNGKNVEGINSEITRIDPTSDETPKEKASAKEPSSVPPWKK